MTTVLDATTAQTVQYCIPLWLRDEQVLANLRRSGIGRIKPADKHDRRIAIVGFGPSLKQTFTDVAQFDDIITVSGSHKFLLEHGVRPEGRRWWHVEVDPRAHKIALLGDPSAGVTYLPASCCHPQYFDHLQAHNATIEMWHVFDNSEDAYRILPREEWAITGGCNVGLRAMTIARFFGYRDLHVFGMDGCEGEEVGKKHAAAHPLQDGSNHALCEYPFGSGQMWRTTQSMLESARQTWHELDMMPDVKATFYGHGLVQTMWKDYVPAKKGDPPTIAVSHMALISAEYRDLNRQLHEENLAYGVGGGKHADVVKKLCAAIDSRSVLDYGCGKGYLGKALEFPIWEYDPAIPGKDGLPRPADLVVCTDVLEHIEPEHLPAVLADMARVTRKMGYFVIHTGPASKALPDGRNTHLIQRGAEWWRKNLVRFFQVNQIKQGGPLLHVVVTPRPDGRVMASVKNTARSERV